MAKLFADDFKLYMEISHSTTNNLQLQLDHIHIWSDIWQMRISHVKCNISTIGWIQNHNPYLLGNNLISRITPEILALQSTMNLNLTSISIILFSGPTNDLPRYSAAFFLEVLPHSSKPLKFTSDQFWSMPLLPGHPPTFIKSIWLSASTAVSPNAFRDAHIFHISNASHIKFTHTRTTPSLCWSHHVL